MSQEQQDRIRQGASNQQFLTEGVMTLRLDTNPVLVKIEEGLRGGNYRHAKKDGELVLLFYPAGEPLLNNIGVQNLISKLQSWIGPHTVQGNFTYDQYENFIYEIHTTLATDIMTNLCKWDVYQDDYLGIVNFIVITAQAFFSRTINDGERNSYASTIHVSESNTVQQNQGFRIPLLGR